jgi:hypothetical protein
MRSGHANRGYNLVQGHIGLGAVCCLSDTHMIDKILDNPSENKNLIKFPIIYIYNIYMKSQNFWDIMSCCSLKYNRRFGRTCRLNLQQVAPLATYFPEKV